MATTRRVNLVIGGVLAIALVLGGWYVVAQFATQSAQPAVTIERVQVTDRSRQTVQVGQKKITVEVVLAPASIQQGLSGRSEIGADGMLFMLPQRQQASFWMKDMQFDLDMIWIDAGKIVDITSNVPAPETTADSLPIYQPNQPVEMVLEVPAGDAGRHNWQVGDVVQLVSQ